MGDIHLNYVEQGAGDALILLHGNGEDLSYFSGQMDFFAKSYHVIALDTRGHGASPRGSASFTLRQFAEDLRAFMDEKGIFLVKGAIDKVAARLGVSKVTIYSYLDEAKGRR